MVNILTPMGHLKWSTMAMVTVLSTNLKQFSFQVRLGVTTNVAWYFYVNPKRWNPNVWLNQYDTLHLLIGHRIDIDPRLEMDCFNIQ